MNCAGFIQLLGPSGGGLWSAAEVPAEVRAEGGERRASSSRPLRRPPLACWASHQAGAPGVAVDFLAGPAGLPAGGALSAPRRSR